MAVGKKQFRHGKLMTKHILNAMRGQIPIENFETPAVGED